MTTPIASTTTPNRRGGKRPGAGAPPGNTNAVKTGVHSARLRTLVDRLLIDPDFIALEHTLVHRGYHQAAARKLLFALAVYAAYLQRARLKHPAPQQSAAPARSLSVNGEGWGEVPKQRKASARPLSTSGEGRGEVPRPRPRLPLAATAPTALRALDAALRQGEASNRSLSVNGEGRGEVHRQGEAPARSLSLNGEGRGEVPQQGEASNRSLSLKRRGPG